MPPLLFTRGQPVMGGRTGTPPGNITITPFYWAPPGYVYTATYKTIINGYIANVAADSQKPTNVFSVGTQYYQQALPVGSPIQHIQYVVTAGAEVDDTTAFPAQNPNPGCVADFGYTDCVTDGALKAELQAKLTALALPMDDAHLYMAMFPSGVETCMGPGGTPGTACSTNVYCAYHGAVAIGMNALVFANEPFMDVLAACSNPFDGTQAPNGDPYADTELSPFSHEANEAITDYSNAWRDAAGYENGDNCGYTYGVPVGGGAGTLYNQVINGGHYYTQDEFSNEDFALGAGDVNWVGGVKVPGCLQQDELPTASFTSPSSVFAGSSAAFNGSASSDPDNAAALTYSWNWGDGTANGSGATPSHVFASPGMDTVALTVTDVDGWSGTISHVITVTDAYAVGVLGTDGGLWVLHAGSPTFTGGGGVLLAAPAVVAIPQISGPAVPLYIGTGSDHALWVRNDSHGWQLLSGGATNCLDNPGAAVIAGTLYVACQAPDHTLWHAETAAPTGTNLPALNVSSWKPLGGQLGAGPAVANVAGTPTYVVVGNDTHVYFRDLVSPSFRGFNWGCIGHPALAAFGSTAYFACHGTDGGLWYSTNTGSGWSSIQGLGGGLVDGVGIAATSTGPIFFAEGVGGNVWQRSLTSSWTLDGGRVTNGVGACAL